MIRRSVFLLSCLASFVTPGISTCPGGSSVSWQVTQAVGGTCPSQMTGGGGQAYDTMISDVIHQNRRRRRLAVGGSCNGVTTSTSSVSCVPYTHIPKEPQTHHRRLGADGCSQCTGSDDDTDDNDYGHDDGIGGGRRLTYDYSTGYEGSFMSFTIMAEVAPDEDPLDVVNSVENDLNAYFVDGANACHTWVYAARDLGVYIAEGTHVYFAETEVESDSVHISRPGDYLDHHYNNNEAVRIGVWVGASVAGLALMVSAKYGVTAYQKRHTIDVSKDVVEQEGGITMNPLSTAAAGGVGSEVVGVVESSSKAGGEV